MKTLVGLMVFLSVVTTSMAFEANAIPGGIVFVNEKTVFYQELSTGKKSSFVLPEVAESAVLSDNGMVLVWATKSEVRYCLLSGGKPILLARAQSPKNIRLSPNSDYVAFESNAGVEIVPLLAPTKGGAYSRMTYRLTSDFHFPVWTREKHTLVDANSYLDTLRDCFETDKIELGPKGSVDMKDTNRVWNFEKHPNPFWIYMMDSGTYLVPRYEGMHKLVVIYKNPTTQTWGPLGYALWESFSFDWDLGVQWMGGTHASHYGHFWSSTLQKKFSSPDCQELAPKPDEIITVLSENKLYSENGEILATNVTGTNIIWLSEQEFLFLGKNGNVFYRNLAKKQEAKVLDFGGKRFSYCKKDPFTKSGIRETFLSEDYTIHFGELDLRFIKSSISETDRLVFFVKNDPNNGVVSQKDIERHLQGKPLKVPTIDLLCRTEFCLIEANSVEEVTDPNIYDYLPLVRTSVAGVREEKSQVSFPLSGKRVLVTRTKTGYAAIKFLMITGYLPPLGKYHNPRGLFIDEKGKYTPLYYGRDRLMIWYEWKYWSR